MIADSFKEYLALLEIDAEHLYVMETELAIADVLKEISNVANIEFAEPDFYNYGYADYEGEFKGGHIWVSPNQVPASFIREEDENYEQFKALEESTSLRYPELSEDCLLIVFSDDKVRKEFVKTLTDSPIKIRVRRTIGSLIGGNARKGVISWPHFFLLISLPPVIIMMSFI
ncbi:hypothetical protein ABIB30_000042 [Pedobacter sp. UYP1]